MHILLVYGSRTERNFEFSFGSLNTSDYTVYHRFTAGFRLVQLL